MNHKMKATFIGLVLLLLGQISYADEESNDPPKNCSDYTTSADCASMRDGFVCIWSNGACVEDKDDY
jgi:hypothetical protein